MSVRCGLPSTCTCCHGRRFVYLPSWRYVVPGRPPETERETDVFESGQNAGDTRMVVSTTREPASAWRAPTQQNLPVSLRICASCGAVQPYVDVAGLDALVSGAQEEAVVIDHDQTAGATYR